MNARISNQNFSPSTDLGLGQGLRTRILVRMAFPEALIDDERVDNDALIVAALKRAASQPNPMSAADNNRLAFFKMKAAAFIEEVWRRRQWARRFPGLEDTLQSGLEHQLTELVLEALTVMHPIANPFQAQPRLR